MATDDILRARARTAYERSRLRFALTLAPAAAVLPITSMALGTPAPSAMILGTLLVLLLVATTWRGGALARGGFSGLKVGLLPLALAHAAKLYGHVCTPEGCTTLCVPACASGGVAAGLLLEWLARRSEQPNVVRGVGAVSCLLTGALGCSCVGASGLLALVAALAVSSTVARLLPAKQLS
jgi:hypothetical protein